MQSIALLLLRLLSSFGFDPFRFISSVLSFPAYLKDILIFTLASRRNALNRKPDTFFLDFEIGQPYPMLSDRFSSAGNSMGHYFHQDLFVARHIHRANPSLHLDIGSRIDGFLSHLLSFGQPVVVGDVRPLDLTYPNLSFMKFDLSMPIPKTQLQSFSSISCLHVIEHVGLGRYGDHLDINGYFKAVSALSQLLTEDGLLYLSFPIAAKSRIEFNAHRVFSIKDSLRLFTACSLAVKLFAYVDDSGNLVEPDEDSMSFSLPVFDTLKYGCGIWVLQKSPS